MPTSTVENYLKCILIEQERAPDRAVSTGQIAGALGVTPGTTTSMIKTLAASGLLAYEPYSGVRLTDAGRQLATLVLRRHRLVEQFLVQVMGMNWSEVHDEAEVLEHAISDRLLERMDEMLGHPSFDPHGDPIPRGGSPVETPELPNLLQCDPGAPLRVARVIDQRESFLQLLERHSLVPGKRMRVVERDADAETVRIQPEEGEPLRLSYRAARMLLVEPATVSAGET